MTRKISGFIAALTAVLGVFALLAPAAHAAGSTVVLHASHQGTSLDDASFAEDGADCGGLDPAGGAVVHFIANGLARGTESTGSTIDVQTNSGLVSAPIQKSNSHGTTQHYFVQLPGATTVISASITFAGVQPDGAKIVISHICPGTPTGPS